MVRAAAEGKALRRQTAEYIVTDPSPIVLVRTGRQSDGAGGWTEDTETTLEFQIVKLQPKTAMGSREVTSPAGTVQRTTHEIIGMPDLDVQVGDVFQWNGSDWTVAFLDDSLEYRTSAEVVRS